MTEHYTQQSTLAIENVDTDKRDYAAPTLTPIGSLQKDTAGTFAGVGPDSGVYS